MRALLAAVAIVAAITAPGCGPSCQPGERVVDEGIRIEAGPYREFQTSAPEGPYLPFEGGTMLRIRHKLGVVPGAPAIYISFTERPLEAYKGGYSQAAGNQAITLRHDAEEVAIKNDSCANYFIRVVISGLVVEDAGGPDATSGDTTVTDAATADTAVADATDGG